MKKLSRQTIAALALGLCVIGPVTAGNVTIPNTFSSGTPAVAAEVNANFGALETAVNDNDSRITTNSNDLAALQTAVTTLQATVAALQDTVTTLQDDLTAANDTIAGLQADLASANSTIASLQSDLANVQANSVLDLDGILVYAVDDYGFPTARFTGVNVQVVNGAGQTTVNGLGNLIVGYNEEYVRLFDFCSDGAYDNQSDCESNGDYWAGSFKSGSHNLVVGSGHSYTRYGGVVFGYRNVINGAYATVSGGGDNFASGWSSSVSGGAGNTASGFSSSVSGGNANAASGLSSSVSGGVGNTASGLSSSVSGGEANTASGGSSSVSGGFNNTASGWSSSVSGGEGNTASRDSSSVSGGFNNTASGLSSSVSGGANRSATGADDWAAGSLFENN